MNSVEVLYLVLPVVLAVGGYVAVLLHERSLKKSQHPAE